SWRPFPVELQAENGDGGAPLEVILFVEDGWLSYLELVYYDRIPPRGFPPPEEFDVVVRSLAVDGISAGSAKLDILGVP
ncbi:MAG: hypothetical protein ACR2NV_04005, partial [Thermoleophilaceae bacterium]